MKNPKLSRTNNIYHYYAGYSDEFVEDIINNYFKLRPNDILLDPWNGSGTSTQVAYKNNIRAYGFDINPAMKYIAKAKLLTSQDKELLINIFNNALSSFKTRTSIKISNLDLLSIWFNTNSIKTIRYLELNLLQECQLQSASANISSFFIVLLFRLLKQLLTPFKTSNPTWIKHTIKDTDRITINKETITQIANIIFNDMISALIQNDDFKSIRRLPCINTSSSYDLPLVDNSIDAIITSPPYCTRIDYTISTLPELALLGFDKNSIKTLRNNMIGSTTISHLSSSSTDIPSKTATQFLINVNKHSSKASSSYYIKYYKKYFHQLYISLQELARVIKPNGRCCIVIQNSYYKDLLIPLNLIIEELFLHLGFTLTHSRAFQKNSTHTNANPSSKKYRTKKIMQFEYVLLLKKGAPYDRDK